MAMDAERNMDTERNGTSKIAPPAYIYFDGEQRSLRASRRIRQGETIVYLPEDPLLDPDQYSLEIYPGIHVDCSQSPAGATNHSCEPNSCVKDTRIIAWKCINPGDEITIDYKITEHQLAVPFDCYCGTKSCRGRIE